MSESSTTTAGPGGRGPAPPLPDKPPSVAERTRLLRSSFRKEEVEKPRVVMPMDNRSVNSNVPPPLPEKPSNPAVAAVVSSSVVPPPQGLSSSTSSVSSSSSVNVAANNGGGGGGGSERSPSPASVVMSGGSNHISNKQSNGGGGVPVTIIATSTAAVPDKTVQLVTSSSSSYPQPRPASPVDVNGPKTAINAAKRDAFFRAQGGGGVPEQAPTVKFDPGSRFGHDRERPAVKQDKELSHLQEMDKDKERDRKYGGETRKELEGYVGFANLPNQVYRKSVKKGFEFTLMVVGESGLGKSTLINSLFLTDLYSAEYPGPSNRIKKTVNVDTNQTVLKENGVQLKLTVVDTPGFGDAVDNSNCWQPITDFIDSKYEEYLNAESRVNRSIMPDTRVHCCLYFIAPTGHGLKPLDVEFMKRLHEKVNIIPLIAKADTLTPDECREFKKTILNEIAQHKIRIYEFPDCDDEEEMKIQKRLRVSDRVPFAVVGSNRVIEMGGKRHRGRQYPWGIVEVENLEHNDFIALRNMLIRTHMQDLKDVTNNVHYENFRYNKLAPSTSEGKIKPGSLTKDPLTQMAEERQEHNLKMKKMEAEMEQVFEMKVKEKKQKLKDSEADLQKRSEQMKKSLEQQQREMDEKWKGFEREKEAWEQQWGERRRSLENQKDHSLRPYEEDSKGKLSPKNELLRLGGSLRRGEHSGSSKKDKKRLF